MGRTRGISLAVAVLAGLAGAPLRAQTPYPILPAEHRAPLRDALDELNMTVADLGFEKDVAEPRHTLKRVRRLLAEPLDLPVMADEILAAAAADAPGRLWALAADLLELGDAAPLPTAKPDTPTPPLAATLDPILAKALTRFIAGSDLSQQHAARAFARLTPDDMAYAAGRLLASTYNVGEDPAAAQALAELGIATARQAELLLEDDAIDPEPAATRYLDIVQRLDMASLLAAGRTLEHALHVLRNTATTVEHWPDRVVHIPTPHGDVTIGTPTNDTYREPALLILDPAGDDIYEGDAGSANGLGERRVSAILDLTGRDRYRADGILGPGAALFGVVALVDEEGDDEYRMAYAGQGAALFGAAWMEDRRGRDLYQAYAMAQAAAEVGIACLVDGQGDDLYDIGLQGQAMAGVGAVALLVDRDGNDRYIAGGRRPDHERHTHRFLSLAQGFAIGMRPFAGGGVAALVDIHGNDTYEADVYGQGVSYWYSAAFLLDEEGSDDYSIYEYGQGAGIHLSAGLLSDRSGHDRYTAHSLGQGAAHDYAVGMLFDHAGNDSYTADHHSQGRAINNSFALLMDRAGRDTYLARDADRAQGIGDNGGPREYGSIALLLDLSGRDIYSCDAADGARLLRPDFGAVYDVQDED